MDNKMERLERELGEGKTTVTILDERQQRMHDDFQKLTSAMSKNTEALTEFSKLVANRRGFVAGMLAVITILGGVITAFLGFMLDWFK